MADTTTTTTATETDIFQQQKKTIELLYDVLQRQQASPQPTYVTPIEQPQKQSPNYLLYAAIGIGAFLLLKGI